MRASSSRRYALALATGVAGALAYPAPALAHGIVAREDLPIPRWLFVAAAGTVLIVSFLALAVLWPQPQLETGHWRALPGAAARLGGRGPEILGGALGAFVLAVVVWSGFDGSQLVTDNFAPTFVYVIFWVGLVFASVLFGDVFRMLNPWRAVARAVACIAGRLARGRLPAPVPYPPWLGRWPAVAGIVVFAWLELVYQQGARPDRLAIAAFLYSALTWAGMSFFGIETWLERGEAFSVYFNLFSRISPFARREGRLGLRRPLSGLTSLDASLPGTVALLAVMIGGITFDGIGEGPLWMGLRPKLVDFFAGHGVAHAGAVQLTLTLGLTTAILVVYALYVIGIAGVRTVAGASTPRLADAFIHSLVPIAVAYVGAHYLTFLLTQGQAIVALASDPLSRGWNLFGTANLTVDYGVIGTRMTWYLQVALVVSGHVAALMSAHDRALTLYPDGRAAVRSQYWMLGVMVAFTTLALVLLAQSA